MPVVNGGLLDGVRRIGARVRDLAVDGGLPGAPLGFRLRGATASGPPPSGTWKARDVVPDGTGALWVATAGGTPGAWVQSGGQVAAVPPPSGDTTGVTDTARIQAIENARTAAGATLIFAPGTYYVTGLTKQPNTIWQGAGRQVTTIKLAAGANKDVVQGANFATLTGTNSQAGITAWSIRDLTIDGNRSGQSGTSFGLRVYGFDFTIQNVTITNCHDDGLYTEWCYTGSVSYGGSVPDSMESLYLGVKCSFNGGWGWHNRGPHDSVAIDCIWFNNNVAAGTAGNLWVEDDNSTQHYLASGLQCFGCHVWGTANWGIIADASLIWTGGEIEGSTYGALLIRGAVTMSATEIYYFTPSASTPGLGIQLGDDGSTPGVPSSFSYTSSAVRISGTGLGNFGGAGRSSAPVAWVNCNKSYVDVHCKMAQPTVAVASNGQNISALTGSQLFVSSVSGFPAGSGTIYVATSGGFTQCTYTSTTAGGSPSFNGIVAGNGNGGTVATGGIVAGDPLGGTAPDIYSTLRIDQGSGGSSGIWEVLSVQRAPGAVTAAVPDQVANAWHLQRPGSSDLLNVNTTTHSSPLLQLVGMQLQGWTSGYGTQTSAWNPSTGAVQPGTASGPGGHIYSGSGAPNITGSGAGDLYLRTDTPSTANQRLYIATGSNTWTGVV